MPEQIPFIRIFISSPGDVNDERKLALEVIEQLPYRPTFREKVAFRVIAWDKPGAGTPMRATLTPQDAINKGLPMPAECDIVIVMFWSRMGTPFVHTDKREYLSGTYWELLNALEAKRPETVIYRRTDEPPFKVSDSDFDAKHAQYKAVDAFFKSDLFYAPDGKIKRGINTYKTPDDFRKAFEIDLEVLVLDILNRIESSPATGKLEVESATDDGENISTIQAVKWDKTKSPFPGLRAFTEEDAPIFFGRGYETDALIKQLQASRFVAVVGASGSGKSSLVGAGLLPRLRANALEGSKDWRIARFTPGENPFDSLYDALLSIFPQFKPNPMEARRIKLNFIADLREAPRTLLDICLTGLENLPAWAEILLFVDQFEELFTLTSKADAQAFADLLAAIAKSERLRVVVTMRHDFYHKAIEVPMLAELFRNQAFSLAIPKRDALRQMIERPAERAGLHFDHALVDRILDDTGDEPGNLALMAYALDELYKLDKDQQLTHEEYDLLGGVQGAIGTRAESQFLGLGMAESVIQQVFHALVEVDERGTATRRREQFQPDNLAEDVRKLIETFTDARLLTRNYDASRKTATVEVAHEAILRSWPRLREWIEDTQDDLRLLRQVRNAAQEWDERSRRDYLLWSQERLVLVYAMQERLQPELNEVERAFIEAEQERLYRELEVLETSHKRRYIIGERLAEIGDYRAGIGIKEGKPDLLWLPVSGSKGKYKFEVGEFEVPDFFISKYLTTVSQVQGFLNSDWDNPDWWRDFPESYQPQHFSNPVNGNANAPRDTISWYQTVAFGRWLTVQFKGLELAHPSGQSWRVGDNAEIRIPTEWEWQWAAMNGTAQRSYPWGDWDEEPRANTTEASINDKSTAVGMYPHGRAECGALDLAGNLWEWCLNDKNNPNIIDGYNNGEYKVLRGGAFYYSQYSARASSRHLNYPNFANSYYGCRFFVCPISAL